MAVSPQELVKLSKAQVRKIDSLEAEVDAAIRAQFEPWNSEELKIPLKVKLTTAEQYHLERRYKKAGWDPMVEVYTNGRQALVLSCDWEDFGK